MLFIKGKFGKVLTQDYITWGLIRDPKQSLVEQVNIITDNWTWMIHWSFKYLKKNWMLLSLISQTRPVNETKFPFLNEVDFIIPKLHKHIKNSTGKRCVKHHTTLCRVCNLVKRAHLVQKHKLKAETPQRYVGNPNNYGNNPDIYDNVLVLMEATLFC